MTWTELYERAAEYAVTIDEIERTLTAYREQSSNERGE